MNAPPTSPTRRARLAAIAAAALLGASALPAAARSDRIHACLKRATTQAERNECRWLPRGNGDQRSPFLVAAPVSRG